MLAHKNILPIAGLHALNGEKKVKNIRENKKKIYARSHTSHTLASFSLTLLLSISPRIHFNLIQEKKENKEKCLYVRQFAAAAAFFAPLNKSLQLCWKERAHGQRKKNALQNKKESRYKETHSHFSGQLPYTYGECVCVCAVLFCCFSVQI